MDIAASLVVFLLVWWLVLFMVLPWGVEAQGVNDEGGLPAAPKNPQLKRKLLITTAIAFVVSAVIVTLIQMNVIDFRGIANSMMGEDLT